MSQARLPSRVRRFKRWLCYAACSAAVSLVFEPIRSCLSMIGEQAYRELAEPIVRPVLRRARAALPPAWTVPAAPAAATPSQDQGAAGARGEAVPAGFTSPAVRSLDPRPYGQSRPDGISASGINAGGTSAGGISAVGTAAGGERLDGWPAPLTEHARENLRRLDRVRRGERDIESQTLRSLRSTGD